jgi:lambda family phage portal protein
VLNRLLAAIGLQRRPKRQAGRRVFAGAAVNRLTMDWLSGETSGKQDVRQDIKMLRGRSRTLVRDTPIGKRYCALFEENVSGHDGFLLQPKTLRGDGEFDKALNAKLAAAWERWSEPDTCTIDGRHSFADVCNLIDRLEPMDGEILIRLIPGAPGGFGFSLQVLDPDQLALDYTVEPIAGSQPWINQGVEMDAWGRPVAYHVWERHPRDQNRGRRLRIPAAQIIHEFLEWRPGAVRGIPWLHAAMQSMNMLGGYTESELVAARIGAAKGGFFKPTDDADDIGGADGPPQEIEPGTFDVLPHGYEFTPYDPQHPTTAFADFHKAVARWIAAGGNVSYTSLSGDLEAVNYSSIRAGLLAERDFYRLLQRRRIQRVCMRIYRAWLPMAQLAGGLDIPAADLVRAQRVTFRARGFPWVDPLKDVQTLKEEIALGINSRSAACAERGRDFERVLADLDAEQQLADEYQVPIAGTAPAPNAAVDPHDPQKETASDDAQEERRRLRAVR